MREEEDNGAVNKNFVNLAIGYLDHLLKKEKKKEKKEKKIMFKFDPDPHKFGL